MPTDRRPCPICAGNDSRLLVRQSFEDLLGSLMNGYDVVCCASCGFAFASGLPAADQFSRYYASMSRYESATSYFSTPEDRARCETIVDLVDALVGDRSIAVMDIGCSTGALLDAFQRRGYPDVQGLDPSAGCAVYARETYDIRVLTGTAAEIGNLPRRYGLVILSAVLEHLLEPRQVLVDVWNTLDEGGLLFAEVPDLEGFAACARAPFQEFSVEHINFFSTVSLSSLMGTAAFRPLVVKRRLLPWLSNSLAPVIQAVFQKASKPLPPVAEDVSEAAVLAYAAACERIEASVKERIEELADRAAPVLVWGVGTHTRHLLRSGALDRLQIAGWVDSDPKYQGAEMRGVPVLSPEEVVTRPEPILVSSGYVHHEIARQIREDLGGEHELILLYD